MFDYETFYGTIRLHSTLRHLSPVAYENITMNKEEKAAFSPSAHRTGAVQFSFG